jgi:RNA polymerase sigma-70 factor (ECF subfamily)
LTNEDTPMTEPPDSDQEPRSAGAAEAGPAAAGPLEGDFDGSLDSPLAPSTGEALDPPGSAEEANPDTPLVLRAQKGDAEAFAELVNRHQRQLYRLALRMTQSEADAQEVLQEAFLNAWEKLPAFRGEAQFSSWLYRIAANAALMRLRRKRRAPDSLPDEPLELAGPKFSADGQHLQPPRSDWSQRADDLLMSRQLGQQIDLAVRSLPEEYRTVFLLKDVDGLSNEQIADALDLTVPAVKSRLHRARLALREKLTEFFGG